jgi:hypothetical protein
MKNLILLCFTSTIALFSSTLLAADPHSILSSIEDVSANDECPECGLTAETITKEEIRIKKSIDDLQHSMSERLRKVAYRKQDLKDDQLALHAKDQVALLHMEINKLKIQQYALTLKMKAAASPDCSGVVGSESRSSKPLTKIESTLHPTTQTGTIGK